MDVGQVCNQAVLPWFPHPARAPLPLPALRRRRHPTPAIRACVPRLKIESAASNSQFSRLSADGFTLRCDCPAAGAAP